MGTTTTLLTGPLWNRCKTARKAAGLSIREMAMRTGLSERAVCYYESPEYTAARKWKNLNDWAEACGLDLVELVGYGPDDPSDLRGRTGPCTIADLRSRARQTGRMPAAA